MKAPFSLCTIAITGDFGKQRGINKMKDWIQVNGGTFVTEITPKVTHLICSKEHFKKDVTLGTNIRYSLFFFSIFYQLLLSVAA